MKINYKNKAKKIFESQLVCTKDKKKAKEYSIILCEDAIKMGGNVEYWKEILNELELWKIK